MAWRVGPEFDGKRMVVRYDVSGGDNAVGASVTDVIGRVLGVDEAIITLERRDGTVVQVSQDAVVIAKVVPTVPRRSRDPHRISVDNLQRICSRGWPALESVALGEWELRAAGGFTRRANSAAVHGDPDRPGEEALAAVIDFYAGRALVPRAQVVEGSPWEAIFGRAGWIAGADMPVATLLQVVAMSDALATPPTGDDDAVAISPTASADWLHRYRRTGDPPGDETARAVVEGPAAVGFATAGDLAIGRVVVTGEWASISCVAVAPSSRRTGIARQIIAASLRWAQERGADKVYVQVAADNSAALALYRSYGFVDHHAYHYLSPPQ